MGDKSVGYKQQLPFCSVGAEGLRIEFDRQCSTERRHDPLTIMDGANRIVSVRSGDDKPHCDKIQIIPFKKTKCMLCVFKVESGLTGRVN